MAPVILKWNPNISSYSMFNYLYDIVNLNFGEEVENNWSVWDYDKIDVGDRYFMVKLTYRFNKFPKNKKAGMMRPIGMPMGVFIHR